MSTITEGLVWTIFFLPVAALLIIAAGGLFRLPSGYSCCIIAVALAGSLALSFWALDSAIAADGHMVGFGSHAWMTLGPLTIEMGVRLDGLTAVMLVVVCSVALLVQIYSRGYMAGDPGYRRYFALMALFTAAMLGLVLADNLVMLFAFWELVGASSYLLIGFWFQRPAAAAAAKKAFIVTRLGDLGLLAALLLIYSKADTLNIAEIHEVALAGLLGSTVLTWIALGVFAGAVGKSAQFPLHVWLPDAMEGPTPVSALIHAATMVAAGVYLVARLFPVFSVSHDAMETVAIVGGITALGAALMGVVMTDIKRVLAYSTISQLGFMMLALGVGAYPAAVFHLMNHAFFKSLLFLGSGSVNHATNTFDMRKMGGLRKYMPITTWTFVIASLSLAGIPPLSGFWSKDEIISGAWDHGPVLFWMAVGAAFLTAFYMFRAIYLTFWGEYRGGEQGGGHGAGHDEQGAAAHPHESPLSMVLPLMVLVVPAVLSGFWNMNESFTHLVNGALPEGVHPHEFHFRTWIAVVSTGAAVLGIGLATAMYKRAISPERVGAALKPLYVLLSNKYYLDTLYEDIFVRRLFYGGLVRLADAFDRVVVDGIVNGVARVTVLTGEGARRTVTGQYQAYGATFIIGVVVVAASIMILNP